MNGNKTAQKHSDERIATTVEKQKRYALKKQLKQMLKAAGK